MRVLFKRQWPLFGLGILGALVCFYLVTSGKAVAPEHLIEDIMDGEGVRLNDIRISQSNPDKGVTWALNAEEVRLSGDQKSISFNKFQLKVLPKDRAPIELTGKGGNYSRDSGDITLSGDLKGSSEDGFRISTEHLLYNEKTGQITTDTPVKISGPFFSVDGRGLVVDLEKETLKIPSRVITVIKKDPLSE